MYDDNNDSQYPQIVRKAHRNLSQGFELVKQVLEQAQPYRIITGARNPSAAQAAYNDLKSDKTASAVTVFPLELSNLKDVKTFAQQTLDKLGQDKIDYLLLNAGMGAPADKPGPHGSKWCETYVVDHLCEF